MTDSEHSRKLFDSLTLTFSITWSLAIAISFGISNYQMHRAMQNIATEHARQAYEKEFGYRRWNAFENRAFTIIEQQGKTAAPVDLFTNRKIVSPSGRVIPLSNISNVPNRFHGQGRERSEVDSHLTGMHPTLPENTPDPWEQQALRSFRKGVQEASTITTVESRQYLRLMRPLIAGKECLQCHARQGYKAGEALGGLSITLPMDIYLSAERKQLLGLFSGHGIFWLIGLSSIRLGTRNIRKSREKLEQLLAHTEQLNHELAEESLRSNMLANEAKKASAAKSEFLANMSHEIRTPMNAIIGMAELMAETELDSRQQRYIAMFQSAGESLLNIINDILDISKIEAGHLEIEETGFNLALLVKNSCDIMTERAATKGLDLSIELSPDLPPHVVGDPARIHQVLVNLVGNAIKFTKQGSVTVRVEQEPCLEHSLPETEMPARDQAHELTSVRFSVIDTGIGIPADKIPIIFKNFTQSSSSTTREYGGTGLGLAISKRLVGLMGGEIFVNSKEGEGSCFTFTISLGIQPEPEYTSLNRVAEINGSSILVVDDNTANRIILKETLSQAGAIITEAETGQLAIEKLNDANKCGHPFDLVVLDGHLPDINGTEIAELIRRDTTLNAASLLLSSDPKKGDFARFRELGLLAPMVKPVKRQALFEAVSKALARKNPSGVVPPAEKQVKSQRILIAEDNPDNQMLIKAFLVDSPHMIDIASNGLEAVEKFTKNMYDLVLMDIQMPAMDGYDATRAIRKYEKEQRRNIKTPVIALTAHATTDERQKCLDAGCDGHITKPVKKSKLLEAIENGESAANGKRAPLNYNKACNV